MENSNNSDSMTIERIDGDNNRNLALRLSFLSFEAKIAFVQLRKVFTKALILLNFELNWYIFIETKDKIIL